MIVGWHHLLDEHEFEETLGDGEGQGSLASCSPWSCRVGHDFATQQHHFHMLGAQQCMEQTRLTSGAGETYNKQSR